MKSKTDKKPTEKAADVRVRKTYTMSNAAREQRIRAARRFPAVVGVGCWVTCKISRANSQWARARYGSVQEALTTLREMANAGMEVRV